MSTPSGSSRGGHLDLHQAAQEYWIHIAQLDTTERWPTIRSSGGSCSRASLALLAILLFYVRPRMPSPDWAFRFAADRASGDDGRGARAAHRGSCTGRAPLRRAAREGNRPAHADRDHLRRDPPWARGEPAPGRGRGDVRRPREHRDQRGARRWVRTGIGSAIIGFPLFLATNVLLVILAAGDPLRRSWRLRPRGTASSSRT